MAPNLAKLKELMFLGERLIWMHEALMVTPEEESRGTGFFKRDIFFTTHRILWGITGSYPQHIDYSAVHHVSQEGSGSGGFAGMGAMVKGGGVVNIGSPFGSVSIQFQNAETLNFANWILKEAMSGNVLQPAQGVPQVEGTRDPNAPPPTPKASSGGGGLGVVIGIAVVVAVLYFVCS